MLYVRERGVPGAGRDTAYIYSNPQRTSLISTGNLGYSQQKNVKKQLIIPLG